MPSPGEVLQEERDFGCLTGWEPTEGEGGLRESNGFIFVNKELLVKIFAGQPEKASRKKPYQIGINHLIQCKGPVGRAETLPDNHYKFILFLWGTFNGLFQLVKLDSPQRDNLAIAEKAGLAKQKLFRFKLEKLEKDKSA